MILAQLTLLHTDGSVEYIVSDDSWRVGTSSILRNNVYLGVLIDNRLATPGWADIGFDDSAFSPVVPGEVPPHAALVARSIPGVTVQRDEVVDSSFAPGDGSVVYDVGTNFAGVLNVSVKGAAGQSILIRYGELLYPNGCVQARLRMHGCQCRGCGRVGSDACID